MRFGLQLVQPLVDGFAIRMCASSAIYSALAYSEYQPKVRSTPGATANAVRGW
jgi:hypothetical protein